MKSYFRLALLGGVVGLLAAEVCAAKTLRPRYAIVDLGVLTDIVGINASGVVAGNLTIYGDRSPTFHAFVYSGGERHDLGTFGGTRSVARGLNAAGDVVGTWDGLVASQRSDHGFLYSNGSFIDLAPPEKRPEESVSAAICINNSGVIGGRGHRYRAVVYSAGKVQSIESTNERYSEVVAINSAGDVVCVGEPAFVYTKGHRVELGTLGGKYSRAQAINDAGQIVGHSSTTSGTAHAFLYSDGKMRDLGVPAPDKYDESDAKAINTAGVIVGNASRTKAGGFLQVLQKSCAYYYSQGEWIDLNTLVDLKGTSLRNLIDADVINDTGQIGGRAMAPDGYHAFVLTPVVQAK